MRIEDFYLSEALEHYRLNTEQVLSDPLPSQTTTIGLWTLFAVSAVGIALIYHLWLPQSVDVSLHCDSRPFLELDRPSPEFQVRFLADGKLLTAKAEQSVGSKFFIDQGTSPGGIDSLQSTCAQFRSRNIRAIISPKL